MKVKKPKSLAAFLKLKPDRALLDHMLQAINARSRPAPGQDNGQFIPHPATWLSRQRKDEVGQPRRKDPCGRSSSESRRRNRERKAACKRADRSGRLLRLRAQKAAISRYLRILLQWETSAGINVRKNSADRAVMRLTRNFPCPEELHRLRWNSGRKRSCAQAPVLGRGCAANGTGWRCHCRIDIYSHDHRALDGTRASGTLVSCLRD